MEPLRVLAVCHANMCRSPLAEHLLRRGLDPGVFLVASAGTHALPDRAMHPYAEQVLAEAGISTSDFRTRRLTAPLVAGADLVLTATREQRSACVALVPAAIRRTFTIPQFGRYAAALTPPGDCPPERRLRAAIDRVPLVRAGLPVLPAACDDLTDPVREPVAAFRECLATIERVVGAVAGLIAEHPPVPGPHG